MILQAWQTELLSVKPERPLNICYCTEQTGKQPVRCPINNTSLALMVTWHGKHCRACCHSKDAGSTSKEIISYSAVQRTETPHGLTNPTAGVL